MENEGMIYLAIIYLVIINLIDFVMFGIDKAKAKRRERRIPEAVLIWTAIIGGTLGALIGMNFFRHKTKHIKFWIGLPSILAMQILIFIVLTFD